MKRPFPAYRGSDPFVFVCYAHSDAETVYSDLVELDGRGIKIWYDEGIPAGSSWRAEIAAAIKGAGKLLYFISEASLHSTHCLREVDYALSHDIEIIPVYLEEVDLPGELELVLNRVHGLFREKDSMYMDHLVDALQGGSGFAAIRPRGKKNTFRTWPYAAAVLLVVVLFVAWSEWNGSRTTSGTPSASTSTPSSYDSYLEGLERLERWDKDDNLERAVELFREAARLDPGFALAYARLAEGLRMRYALSGEEDFLEEAASVINEAVRLGPDLGPVQVALGRLHATRGNFDLATAALERALDIDPNDAVANQAIAGVYKRLGRPDDAESYYRRAVALDPDNPTSHDAYANFLFDQGRLQDAIGEWQLVIRLAPDHYAARVNMGSVLADMGRLPEAITMYQQANEIRPSYMAWSNMGTAYSRAERYQEAIDAYRAALKLNDSDWLAWGNLAYVYSWMGGKEQEARETFEKAIELAEAAKLNDPRDPYIHSDLGLYYAKTGSADLALQHQETALVLAPESGEILAAASEGREILGQRDKAVELARKSLAAGYKRQNLQRNPEFASLLQDPRMESSRD
ncbi:MAG: tetratricopeptide repeat protein [Gammaproteobacteria bacterium]|nr:tetratricopeptide repeat protein [Gammaproteobacteria bacterium]